MNARWLALCGVLLAGCGMEVQDSLAVGSVESQKHALITFTPTSGTYLTAVAAGPMNTGSWVYARSTASNQLLVGQKGGNTIWSTGIISESIQGRPAATGIQATSPICDIVFAQKTTGAVGFFTQHYEGEFQCAADSTGLTPIPGSSTSFPNDTITASSWFSGGVQRVDVFHATTSGYVSTVTGTGPNGSSITWGSWTTDTGITMKAGTGPAAVSVTPGRIDLFACNAGGALMQKTYSSGAWGGWNTVIASGCNSTPSATGTDTLVLGRQTLAVVQLQVATNDGGTLKAIKYSYNFFTQVSAWETSWTTLGGTFTGPPAVHRTSGNARVWGFSTTLNAMAYGDF